MWSFFRNRRRRKLLAVALPPLQLEILKRNVPAFNRLSEEKQQRMLDCVRIMIAEQHWEGCERLVVSAEMKTTIAGHAALMLLCSGDYYFDSVSSILVYPSVMVRNHDGVIEHTVGEAWDNGGVILSWPEVLQAANHRDGDNVVIHEFAHHLDGLDGEMGGSISFDTSRDQSEWEHVARTEFQQHVQAVEAGRRTLIDPYGATNEAEFFAVASECFFERPAPLHDRHQALFTLLKSYYRVDPRDWH
ncbi:Protein MtfA [Novipirellula galeiformis]|uniref:Protein MtfA n=1 Tax=Novipirellula galeiformis TaxID=2528004 RepID=A0A5C6CCH0_9BACT|nr:M90 family metallopeptidase [Novipirellula galeiformis]TWU21144.1 Protein MtfA [Novipirellula galeiformis]